MGEFNFKLSHKYVATGSANQIALHVLNHSVAIIDDLASTTPRPDYSFSPVACEAIFNVINADAMLYGFNPRQFIYDNFKITYHMGQIVNMQSKNITYVDNRKQCTIGFLYCLNMDLEYQLNHIVNELRIHKIIQKINQLWKQNKMSNKQSLAALHNTLFNDDFENFAKVLKQYGLRDFQLALKSTRISTKVRNQIIRKVNQINQNKLHDLTHANEYSLID